VAWRLNANRALISLIGRQTQYFVAESTKTLNIGDDGHEDPDDGVWAGCSSVSKEGRLCEHTLEAMASSNGQPAYFEVCDLSKDPRFNRLPFISGEPGFRYYIGVPIVTKRGVAIGSLFAMDIVARDPINESQRNFMTAMASNIMQHFEMLREREDRRRAIDMNMCLAAFVDPMNQSRKRKRRGSATLQAKAQVQAIEQNPPASTVTNDPSASTIINDPSVESPASPRKIRQRMDREDTQASAETHNDSTMTESDSNTKIDDEDHMDTFKRAANLLFESLFLEGGGGVAFFDEFSKNASIISTSLSQGRKQKEPPSHDNTPRDGVDILSSASSDERDVPSDSRGAPQFIPLAPEEMATLIKRYPRGRMFTLDKEAIHASASSGDDTYSFPEKHSRSTRRTAEYKADISLLHTRFPSARQVIFVPLWDSISGRWAACFAFNSDDYRTLTHANEFLYTVAFCNCVATEISRLASISADQQKQNFIGSISHELRSPLHGILGSMEFLGETEITSFQHSLIDTANSCAVTLLDTIQQILDFSKVNAFERNANRAARRRDLRSGGQAKLLAPHLNIYGLVDLAAITEEVVEGVATGQEFKDITKSDTLELLPAQSRSRTLKNISGAETPETRSRRPDVEVIVDIEPRSSWAFVTQPGAFRRIIMNIFGNALKYTQKGFIKVKLEARTSDEGLEESKSQQQQGTKVILTIEDSGQGISPQFLRSKLFTPFSQENSLNPGTGLGLSLVKQIIYMLGGEIRLNSVVGIGTEVVVELPMSETSHSSSSAGATSVSESQAGSGAQHSGSTPSSAGSLVDRARDESIAQVTQVAEGKHIALYRTDRPSDSQVRADPWELQRACLLRYFLDWYKFSSVSEWTSTGRPDIIIVDESDLQSLMTTLGKVIFPLHYCSRV
jgi:signal transduction histidine kinase